MLFADEKDPVTIIIFEIAGENSIMIEVKYLHDCKKHIPALARLWYEEISRHWNSEASVEKAAEALHRHAQIDKMPLAIVALNQDKPIGMACLRESDGIRPEMKPWLGSLVVDPQFRGKRLGENLINQIKALAKSRGHEILYLLAFDPTIPDWYAKLGWKHIGYDSYLGHRVTVMSITI
ncbi:hypothetical protein AQUSIP_06600 [Aquicella siphonis]|uniref:N-acetyltransferase domain-containing protein n=1 Tax=Aquicella siphonis TaxID=254247 RepID=A0A5E4PEH3_9COXI|nr:GNAT family N-acetyltransferase [Aquicella siphonis]VVC75370.1 hypothetical protein AQUSIP_06600 [Aquicella siphonis]